MALLSFDEVSCTTSTSGLAIGLSLSGCVLARGGGGVNRPEKDIVMRDKWTGGVSASRPNPLPSVAHI